MTLLSLNHYLLLSAVLFTVGLLGFLIRRNLIIMFLCTEIMFQAAIVAMIGFSAYHMNVQGQVFLIFIVTVAAAEAVLALALIVMLYRRRGSLDAEQWSEMQG